MKEGRYQGLAGVSPVQAMDREEAHAFLTLGICERKRLATQLPPPKVLVDSLLSHHWPQILTGRLTWAGVEDWQDVVTPEVLLVLANLRTSDSPGSAVM